MKPNPTFVNGMILNTNNQALMVEAPKGVLIASTKIGPDTMPGDLVRDILAQMGSGFGFGRRRERKVLVFPGMEEDCPCAELLPILLDMRDGVPSPISFEIVLEAVRQTSHSRYYILDSTEVAASVTTLPGMKGEFTGMVKENWYFLRDDNGNVWCQTPYGKIAPVTQAKLNSSFRKPDGSKIVLEDIPPAPTSEIIAALAETTTLDTEEFRSEGSEAATAAA